MAAVHRRSSAPPARRSVARVPFVHYASAICARASGRAPTCPAVSCFCTCSVGTKAERRARVTHTRENTDNIVSSLSRRFSSRVFAGDANADRWVFEQGLTVTVSRAVFVGRIDVRFFFAWRRRTSRSCCGSNLTVACVRSALHRRYIRSPDGRRGNVRVIGLSFRLRGDGRTGQKRSPAKVSSTAVSISTPVAVKRVHNAARNRIKSEKFSVFSKKIRGRLHPPFYRV